MQTPEIAKRIKDFCGDKIKCSKEFGNVRVMILDNTKLFKGFEIGEIIEVWMSHSDSIAELAPNSILQAITENGVVAGLRND